MFGLEIAFIVKILLAPVFFILTAMFIASR